MARINKKQLESIVRVLTTCGEDITIINEIVQKKGRS